MQITVIQINITDINKKCNAVYLAKATARKSSPRTL